MESKHSDRLLPLNLNLTLVIFLLSNTTYSFMDLHPEITLWLSVFKLAKTTSIQKGSQKNEKIEHENIYQLANACSISRLIPGVWSHVLYMWVCESWWILFTLEKSEMLGSPILKLTGPFGSNHQMCHGKNHYVMVQGTWGLCQHQYFLSSLATDVNLTALMSRVSPDKPTGVQSKRLHWD